MASNNQTSLTQLSSIAVTWLNRLSPILMFFAVIWLCWSIARIVWLFLAPVQPPLLPPVARQVNSHAQSANQNTFSVFATPQIAPQQPNNPTPSQPNNIKLKGVMTATPRSQSSAMISVNGKIKNYRVGKQLEGSNFTLVSVDWNEITLEDNANQSYTISMNDPLNLNQEFQANGSTNNNSANNNRRNTSSRSDFSSQASAIANMAATSTNAPNVAPPVPENLPKPSENTAQNSVNSAIDKAVSELQQNPSGYLSKMGVMASGEGYEVTASMSSQMRSRLGLKAGDKVLSLNGQSIGSNPTDDAFLLKQVQQSGQAQIQVKRGEQVITIRQQF